MRPKKRKKVMFSSTSLEKDFDYAREIINKLSKKGYDVKSTYNGIDTVTMLIYNKMMRSNKRGKYVEYTNTYNVALLDLDVLLYVLDRMNGENPIFENCEEKSLSGLVDMIESKNKHIKVIVFSQHDLKSYGEYKNYDVELDEKKHIPELSLKGYIDKKL